MNNQDFSEETTAIDRRSYTELEAGTRVGEYEIIEKIGEGGMGFVYAGHHPVIGKKVAIKVLQHWFSQDPAIASRFLREAKAVNAIGHENIVDIFAFGELPTGQLYLVMEFLTGRSLRDRLRDAGGGMWQDVTARAEAFRILLEVCDALSAAHATGIVHRDLKPDNIFLTMSRTGTRTKLLDFGIAKEIGSGTDLQKTSAGTPIGTPLYMSPEQCRGMDVDCRADLYALGVIMYEMFAGVRPFSGESFIDVLNGHMSVPPPQSGSGSGAFSSLHRELQTLILACLEKAQESRPTLDEVIANLNQLVVDFDLDLRPSSIGSVRLKSEGAQTPRTFSKARTSYVPWYIATAVVSALLSVGLSVRFEKPKVNLVPRENPAVITIPPVTVQLPVTAVPPMEKATPVKAARTEVKPTKRVRHERASDEKVDPNATSGWQQP